MIPSIQREQKKPYIRIKLKSSTMCLFTYQEQPVIADRPIECVKIMRRYERNGKLHNLFSFVHQTEYQIGELIRMKVIDADELQKFECPDPKIGNRDSVFGNNIYEGFETVIEKGARSKEDEIRMDEDVPGAYRYRTLHRGICSFISEEDTRKTFDWAVRTFDGCAYEICMVKCEIPAGAKYWKGVSNCTGYEHGYVSDQIIPHEILKTQRTL